MFRPHKMKFIELTVFKNDIDVTLEYLGTRRAVQFNKENYARNAEVLEMQKSLDRLLSAADFLGINFTEDEKLNYRAVSAEEKKLNEIICEKIEDLNARNKKEEYEKKRVLDILNEIKAFSKMNMPFSDLDHLSYIVLRIGRLDPKSQSDLRDELGDRVAVVPLETENRILAISSKKGRFALDSALKKLPFESVEIPEDYRGVPSEMFKSLEDNLSKIDNELLGINNERNKLCETYKNEITQLVSLWKTAIIIEELKSNFTVTENFYNFSGWILDENVKIICKELFDLTNGRIAIRCWSPDELPSVINGSEKVPVAMKNGAFVKGFENVVFSYAAPLYGTIDPTPFVAVFFTLLFGIMFGDVGHGLLLLTAGILIKKIPKLYEKFSKYSTIIVSVGISSTIMGFLEGSVFTNEKILEAPSRMISAAVTGKPVDHILRILPMASEGGSLKKMFYFFGFTIAFGIVLNSISLLINIINRFLLKKYESAFFSKTGLAGLLMFWYVLFIVVRIILGGRFATYDFAGIFIPVIFIFFGPVIWRIISGKKPVLEHGLFNFIMEGFVEVLETISTYFSNTLSFLRVGAFALSHAVLSFIVFRFSQMVANSGFTGAFTALLIMVFGNAIIFVLEGMIVVIQTLRLQYYEFFSKFIIETGVEFSPFQFKKK